MSLIDILKKVMATSHTEPYYLSFCYSNMQAGQDCKECLDYTECLVESMKRRLRGGRAFLNRFQIIEIAKIEEIDDGRHRIIRSIQIRVEAMSFPKYVEEILFAEIFDEQITIRIDISPNASVSFRGWVEKMKLVIGVKGRNWVDINIRYMLTQYK
jgi:hypothetical protein